MLKGRIVFFSWSNMSLSQNDQETFKSALKELVETHKNLKTLNAEAKELRNRLKSLKTVVMGFMQVTALDVCHVSHGGREGEISINTRKRTTTLDKEAAISEIQKYLTNETAVDKAEDRATEIWNAMQQTRTVQTHKDLSVKKF
tara:strand:+ start:1368 stop:1799 length:432 start_codon:yes stop_codon:yes gene_type:complete